MKKLPLTFLIAGAALAVSAQPVLELSDIGYTVGDSWVVNLCEHQSEGPAGANQTWDFSDLVSAATATIDMADPSTTPFASDYPNATAAQHIPSQDTYHFFESTSTLNIFGFASGSLVVTYSDEEEMFSYPLTYASTHSDNFVGSFTNTGYDWNRTGTVNSEVDGYGTLITPTATYTDVLRVKVEEEYTDVPIGISGSVPFETEIYHWYKAGIGFPIMINIHLMANGQVQSNIQYIDNNVGIEDATKTQVLVYPNPTTDQLFVSGDAFKQASFEILNTLGQVVKQGTMNAGSIAVSDLHTGIYVLRATLESGEVGVSRFQVTR